VQLTYLAFDKVTNTGLGHDGDGHCLHDLLDHGGVGHARDATLNADIGGYTLESHDSGGTSFFSDASLSLLVIRIMQLKGIEG
jgi:hypothetical protein